MNNESTAYRFLVPGLLVAYVGLLVALAARGTIGWIDLPWAIPVGLAVLGLLAVAVVTAPISLGLLGVLLLQLVGVLRRVPFSYNLRNLLVRWQTTSLTALAFVFVVALLTVMLAFVNGMYFLTKNTGDARNVFVLADGATDEIFSTLGYGDSTTLDLQRGVQRDEEQRPLASWELYCVANQPITTRRCPVCNELVGIDKYGRELAEHGSPPCAGSGTSIVGQRGRRLIQVRGVKEPQITARVHNLSLKEGRWFTDSGVARPPGDSRELWAAVLGEGLARELGPDQGKPTLEVGDTFELGPDRWVIVGILDSSGSTFDSEVWAKMQVVNSRFGKQSPTTCVLRTESPAEAQKLADYLKSEFKSPAVAAQVETDYYTSLNSTNQQFLYATIVVMLIMAIGCAFGVMNTMFAAISQRTKDIGVMRILGYTRLQVLTSFFMEALALAVVGGLLGCALGSLCNGLSATSNIASGPGGGKSVVIRLIVDAWVLSIGMGFALFMGCVGGLLPALSAMRLRPLESLR